MGKAVHMRKKYCHRHLDPEHPIQECTLVILFPLSASSSPKATGPFCKAFFSSQDSISVCIWNPMDEQNLFIWELDATQSLPVNSTFAASPVELPQEISASRVSVSWTIQEGYLEVLNCCLEVSNWHHLGSKGQTSWRIIFLKKSLT